MQQSRPTPAPIFNHRKRPRQAVIAEPQDDDPSVGPAGAAAAPRYSDLIPPNMFGQPSRPHAPVPGSSRGAASSRPPIRGQTTASRRPTARGGSSTRGGGWQASNAQQGRNMGGNFQQTNNAQKFTSSTFKRQPPMETPTYRPSSYTGNTFPSHGPQTGANYQTYGGQQTSSSCQNYGPTVGNSYQNIGPQGDASLHQNNQPRVRGYNNQRTGTAARGGYPSSRGISNAPTRGDHTSYPMRGGARPYNPSPAKAATATSTFNASNAVLDEWDGDTKPIVQPKKPTKVESELDKSMHVLTLDVAGVHRWNKHKDKIPMMFELYGYLDSAITRNEERCKAFLIRDDRKEAIKCVFYEIDRSLPKLTRGQWQRCVGTLDTRTGRFKCISLRPVSDGERRLVPKLIGNTATFMQGLTSKLRES